MPDDQLWRQPSPLGATAARPPEMQGCQSWAIAITIAIAFSVWFTIATNPKW
jgi:hypothetical protein